MLGRLNGSRGIGGQAMDRNRGTRALTLWATLARIAIGVFVLVMVALILGNGLLLVAELSSGGAGLVIWQPATGVQEVSAYGRVFALILGGSDVLLGMFFLLAAVPIAGWIYRAHANLREGGVSELTYSPLWSVGSFLVPLVNFVVPFRAMRELHNRSHGEGAEQAGAAVGDVSSWWSCHLAAWVVVGVATFVAMLATIPNLYVLQPPGVNTGLFLFALVLLTGSAAFLFRTIGAVTRAHQQMLYLNAAEVFA
jgi:hypothetical protein